MNKIAGALAEDESQQARRSQAQSTERHRRRNQRSTVGTAQAVSSHLQRTALVAKARDPSTQRGDNIFAVNCRRQVYQCGLGCRFASIPEAVKLARGGRSDERR